MAKEWRKEILAFRRVFDEKNDSQNNLLLVSVLRILLKESPAGDEHCFVLVNTAH